MPTLLIVIGVFLFIAAIRGNETMLGQLLRQDFEGVFSTSFIWWFSAIAALLMLGYIKPIRSMVIAFLILVAIAILVSNRGLFADLQAQMSQISSGSVTPISNTDQASWNSLGNQANTATGGGGGLFGSLLGGVTGGSSGAGSAIGTAATVAMLA